MNVLLIRTSALGDVVHCLPVLTALRRRHPEARIGWVVERPFAPLLAGHPAIDELIPVSLRRWRRRPWTRLREIGAEVGALRRFRADVAVDLMGNHKGALLARASGARRRIGAARPFRREGSSAAWINEGVATPGEHAVERALALLAALDVRDPTVDFGGDQLCREAPAEARAFLAARRAPWVVIQVGAGWGNKSYPPAWWGAVAARLAARGYESWVPIAPGEEGLARAVAAASDGAARCVDAASLPALAALLRHPALVLGGDTGPLHLAHAFGTPVLCLIGPTDPRRNGPYGAPERVLWHRLPCSFCYKRFPEPKACLLDISPTAVADRALELLAARR